MLALTGEPEAGTEEEPGTEEDGALGVAAGEAGPPGTPGPELGANVEGKAPGAPPGAAESGREAPPVRSPAPPDTEARCVPAYVSLSRTEEESEVLRSEPAVSLRPEDD